ncbi:MAG: glycosyltransferase family 39 protein, partial [Candidatus Binatia bacterium]
MAEFLKRVSTRVSTRMAAVSRSTLLLILIVALGSFLRLFDLAEKSLWLDEIKSLEHAQSIHDLKSFFNPKTGNAHPPLYFLLLRGWLSFGDGEFYFRLLSVLFGVLCIPATYFLGKQLFDTRTSLWAASMVAVSPFLLLHDREVRMYPMLVFFLLLSLLCYVRALRGNRVRDWIGLTISMSVSVYTHYHAFLIFAAMWLFFIVRIKPYRSRLAPWLASSAVVTALFGFWLPGFLYHLERQAIYTPPDLFPSNFGQWLLPIYIFFSYSLGQTVMPWNLWVVAPGAILFGGLCFWGLKSSAASKEALPFFLLFLFSLLCSRYGSLPR